MAMVGVQGPEEVLRVVFAAYRTCAAGREWDPSAGATTLNGPTVDACARLGAGVGVADRNEIRRLCRPGLTRLGPNRVAA